MLLKYFFAWFGMTAIAIANGGIRERFYKAHVGDLRAHQISTVTLLTAFTAYFLSLAAFWPIEASLQAWQIGAMWLVMTLVFEFGMGRFLSRLSWSRMLQEYNVFAGKIWILIPVWVLVGPYVLFRFTRAP